MTTPRIAFDAPVGEYLPGACNIGPAEMATRRRAGYLGLGAAVVLALVLIALDAPAATRWLVAMPLGGGAVGLLQARFRFCAAYGIAGLRNFGPLGGAERVADGAARRADRARAAWILLAGAAIGLGGALAFVLLPL
jgi:hypothetical protein